MATRNATPMTATLLAGSMAVECNRTIRYDWTEYALIIDWASGHEQHGETQTRSACDAMTLAAAQAEAKAAHEALVNRVSMATGVKLTCQIRTCTIATAYTPDYHEDGDGTPRCTDTIVAGSKWDTSRGRHPTDNERNFNREAINACKALHTRCHRAAA